MTWLRPTCTQEEAEILSKWQGTQAQLVTRLPFSDHELPVSPTHTHSPRFSAVQILRTNAHVHSVVQTQLVKPLHTVFATSGS